MTAAPHRPVDVVALGGGHGLAATLSALRRVTPHLTAVVGVSDDGGSSGRIREQFGVVPPGDLRMALAALCGDDTWGSTWAQVLQHRFTSAGDLDGHALGNLIITALWEQTGDLVAGLEWVARLLDARGTVLPLALEPLQIIAQVRTASGQPGEVRGQVQVATTADEIESIRLEPAQPTVCAQAVAAVMGADVIVLGPGSWFTSVLPHFEVPQMRVALHDTPARRVLVLNLTAQSGETSGFSPQRHLEVLLATQPGFRLDTVVADPRHVAEPAGLADQVAHMGADLVLAEVAGPGGLTHDAELLASTFRTIFQGDRIGLWR